jgi:hypothetical protein
MSMTPGKQPPGCSPIAAATTTPTPTYADSLRTTMNRVFKKKTADAPGINVQALNSLNNAAPPLLSPGSKKPSTSRWKKGKKQVEVKPTFDIESALPTQDDFRTSMLMTGLSARFSMLREQDDPNSLIGKASDDSVLQPRRKSRINELNYGGSALGNIDEMSDFIPPFANNRTGSYASEDGYNSDAGGSVMSRARPGEGNILFGGRQKIYRIANSGTGSARSLGKAVYEDDIGASAFQRYRQRERERDESSFNRTSDESSGFDFGLSHAESAADDHSLNFLHNDSAKDLSHSPSLSSYDKNRSTTSSVARSEARSSTAATSIASIPGSSPAVSVAPASSAAGHFQQTLDRSNTKSRRLYEQGLDQHMRDEQISAMSRLNTFQRQRTQNGKTSPPYLHGAKSTSQLNERAAQPVYALRTQSPTMNGALSARSDLSKYSSNTPSPAPSSPIDPQLESHQFDLQQALDPADRGKATAIGAFNKPKQAFDEHQYLERQRQLMKSASNTLSKSATPSPSASYHAEQQDVDDRKRSEDSLAQALVASAAVKKAENKSYNVFQKAAQQLQEQTTGVPTPNRSPLPDTHRTFFGSIQASDSEDEEDGAYGAQQFDNGNNGHAQKWQPAMPSVSEHPAVRGNRMQTSLEEEREEDFQPAPLVTKSSSRSLQQRAEKDEVESPTLGQESQPLGSMMHHLRSKSNASSMYPADEEHSLDVPRISTSTQSVEEARKPSIGKFEFESSHDSTYSGSNPWDLDEAENRSLHINTQLNNTAVSPIEPSGRNLFADAERRPVSPIQSGPSAAYDQTRKASVEPEDATSWQQELRRQHTRDISSATQQERDAFASELAARRNAIRENIKSIVDKDNHSRDPSPAPASANGPFKAFGMLRTKASGESLAHMREQQLRSAKSTTSINTNVSQADRTGFNFDGTRSRGNSSPRPPMPPNSQHPAFQRQPSRDRANHRNFHGDAQGSRSRSNSTATTGRSRSRPGLRRDDSDRMADSTPSLHDMSPMPRDVTPKLSAEPSTSLGESRFSNEAKSPLGYFESLSRPAPAVQARPPPRFETPNGYNPIRPAPIASVTVPLLSSSSTPVVPAYAPPTTSTRSRSNTLRKKTISKADISEPTLLETTANFDTVDLPEGASLKNGMAGAPPIPPINPKRRGTRNKLFTGIGGRNDPEEFSAHPYNSPVKTPSGGDDASQRSQTPEGDFHFPPSNVVRIPSRSQLSPNPGEYEQSYGNYKSGSTPDRGRPAVSADGGMF